MGRGRQATVAVLTTVGALLAVFAMDVRSAEVHRLDAGNWDELAPAGKEVDCIYGDYVLRNDQLTAVIADPIDGRNANMTVRNVSGALIDLTPRDRQNDQLSAFYPGASYYQLRGGEVVTDNSGAKAGLRCTAAETDGQPQVVVEYLLTDGQPWIEVVTQYKNPHAVPIEVELTDAIRADRSFLMGLKDDLRLFWCYDEWWGQAYGIMVQGHSIKPVGDTVQRGRPFVAYDAGQGTKIPLQPGAAYTLRRFVSAGANLLDVLAIAHQISGRSTEKVVLAVSDPDGAVAGADVKVRTGAEEEYASARTDDEGRLRFAIPAGRYNVEISGLGRPARQIVIDAGQQPSYQVALEGPAYVMGRIKDDAGKPIPCKVQFRGRGVDDPYFGPDTMVRGVNNLIYTETGEFRTAIAPGTYDVMVSHGNEHDAVFATLEAVRGQDTALVANLVHSVQTPGWVSSDFHSHSSPSGDNTSSQLGRVMNLLCEHIEFAPCTEHNRISSYAPHLKTLGAEARVATCSGIELTGSPLPLNHQNAFPLKYEPRTQDGGGPQTHENPVVQIERLALWDEASNKLVQGNHPNLVQMLDDKDLDGRSDGGFEKMFGYMDVVEVHPPQTIFTPPDSNAPRQDRGNTIFNWMQMLNLGYRIPGVVNTDAHYTFHGSGWLRNYLKSPTDDPSAISVMDMVAAAEKGNVIMTNGPYLEVEAVAGEGDAVRKATAGDDLAAPGGNVAVRVRVQCPNWLDVNRVQLFLNGHPAAEHNITRRRQPQMFTTGTLKFDQTIPLQLAEDTHVIVAVIGEGLSLAPVMGPDHAADQPVAVANPIFVDVNGGGFQPNGDLLGVPITEGN